MKPKQTHKRKTRAAQVRLANPATKAEVALLGERTELGVASVEAFFHCAQTADLAAAREVFRAGLEGDFMRAIVDLDEEFFRRVQNSIRHLRGFESALVGKDSLRADLALMAALEREAGANKWLGSYLAGHGVSTGPRKIADLVKMFPNHSEKQIRRAAADCGLKIRRTPLGRVKGTPNRL